MELDKYASEARKTATYPHVGMDLLYPGLGIAGEAGEVANNIKKLIRDYGYKSGTYLPLFVEAHPKARKLVENTMEEVGDVLWYVAILCYEMGISMQELASDNNKKLAKRYSNRKFAL